MQKFGFTNARDVAFKWKFAIIKHTLIPSWASRVFGQLKREASSNKQVTNPESLHAFYRAENSWPKMLPNSAVPNRAHVET